MRELKYALLAGALALGGTLAQGSGAIQTIGATIDTGAAPSKGAVTLNGCAPPGTAPGAIMLSPVDLGTQGLAVPPAPSLGAGGMGSFSSTTNMTLPGGTYEYTDYTVLNSAVITYQGAVTIRVTGIYRTEGTVRTTASNASITIHCDSFLVSGQVQTGVETTGTGSDIDIVGVTQVSVNTPDITSADGSVSIGVMDTTFRRGASFSGCDVSAPGGTIDVLSSGPVVRSDSDFTALGPIQVLGHEDPQGNGRAISMSQGSTTQVDPGFDILMEAESGDLELVGTSRIESQSGWTSLTAFSGDALIDQGSVARIDSGDLWISATGRVEIDDGSSVESDDAQVLIRSEAGFVILGDSTGSGGGPCSVTSTSGPIRIEGGGSIGVEVAGASFVNTMGDITLFATSGELYAANLASTGGTVLLGATNNVNTSGTIDGDSIVVQSLDGTDIGGTLTATDEIDVVAAFSLGITGTLSSGGDTCVESRFGDINIQGASITTMDTTGAPSGGVLIESHFTFGVIFADGATVRSGTSDQASGNVSLRVLGGGTPGPVSIDSFIAPKSVRARLNTRKPDKSFLTVTGTVDTGTVGPLAAGAATFTAGPVTINGTLTAKGRTFQLVTDDAKLRLVPPKSGGSKVKFNFRVKRDLTGLAADQALALRLTNGSVDATGNVTLEGHRFKQGKNPAALTFPDIFPVSCRAVVKGDTKDSLSLKLAFGTTGTPPATAPDVTLTFGNTFTVTIPGAEFSGPTKERFSAKRPDSAPAVSRATLDYGREFLTISIRGVNLGAFAAGDTVPVTIGLTLGTDQRAVDVVLARKGSRLSY